MKSGEAMPLNSAFGSPRSAVFALAVFAALVSLQGCGGGGGGGGGGGVGAPNPGFAYPTSLMAAATADIGGFSAAYSLDKSTNVLTSILPGAGGTVVVNLNSPLAGDYTVTVGAIPHPAALPEASFSFVAAAASLAGGGSVQGTGCNGCFRTGNRPASDGETVEFVDLNLAAAQFTYSTLGIWRKPSDANPALRDVGGAFSFGVLTRGVDLPTSGTANYRGFLIGRYAGPATDPSGITLPANVYTVGATATATANFAGRSVTFATANSVRTAGGVSTADNRLNLNGSLSYTAGMNSLTSTSLTSAAGVGSYNMSGAARASFYGPPGTTAPFAPPELGGALAVANPGGTQSMVGSFGLRRQ